MLRGIQGRYKFSSQRGKDWTSFGVSADVAFVGEAVDDRGRDSINIVGEVASDVCTVEFERDRHRLIVNGREITRERLASKVKLGSRILLDVTTLGLAEILSILLALRRAGSSLVEFLYAEPGIYNNDDGDRWQGPHGRDYRLTENRVFSSIQGFNIEHIDGDAGQHVFMLGFEPSRVQNALEQRDDIGSDRYPCHFVVGLPAFRAGWESNSVRPHLSVMERLSIHESSIHYCEASSIREAYLTLWRLYGNLKNENGCFYVSPFGTKPHSVGAALFLLETKGADVPTGLYYDHPERVVGRSRSVEAWHHVCVSL